jgi:hypothetical protein
MLLTHSGGGDSPAQKSGSESKQPINTGKIDMKIREAQRRVFQLGRRLEGRILPPLILWMLGVPGGIVVVLWFVFFRDSR